MQVTETIPDGPVIVQESTNLILETTADAVVDDWTLQNAEPIVKQVNTMDKMGTEQYFEEVDDREWENLWNDPEDRTNEQ